MKGRARVARTAGNSWKRGMGRANAAMLGFSRDRRHPGAASPEGLRSAVRGAGIAGGGDTVGLIFEGLIFETGPQASANVERMRS